MALTFTPAKLSSQEKEKLDDLTAQLKKLEWEKGEYFFHNFVDYYQLPQIVKVEQSWQTNLVKAQSLYLQALFDRYMLIATPLSSSSSKSSSKQKNKYLIPDWYQGECKILSKNPVLKKRWWVFQGAFELYRFDLPRDIKILSDTPAHVRPHGKSSTTHEWDKIVLRKNARLSVVRREKYQSRVKNDKGELIASEPKEAFVLLDNKRNEFIVPPGVPLRFATLIEENELHSEYRSHDGSFTFPEIMMRYEFPLDIEIVSHLPVDLPHFKSQLRLEKFCVAKSVIAYLFGGDTQAAQIMELSPLTQFTLHCAKCLTYGLPRENEPKEKEKEEKFDEKEYQTYESIRSQMNLLFDDAAEVFKSKIQLGTDEEIECIEAAYEISMNLKADEDRPLKDSYFTTDDAIKAVKESNKDDIPFPKSHPKKFTVHASADPSNPYNEVIDYEEMDALTEPINKPPSKNDSKTSSKTSASAAKGSDTKSSHKSDKASSSKREKPQQPTNQSGARAALVVQQLPPPMMLPPEAFERTLKAIPELLYTDFIPATKKPEKSTKAEQPAKTEKLETEKLEKKSQKSDKEHKKSSKK